MKRRSTTKCQPRLEPMEPKRLLSAGGHLAASGGERPPVAIEIPRLIRQQAEGDGTISAQGATSVSPVRTPWRNIQPSYGYLVFRRTNPSQFNNKLKPPFGHVLVQDRQPIPGQVYNVLSVVVRNGTAQDFDASSGFEVRFPGQKHSTPILTGDQVWKAGQEYIFYVMTKKYYPLPNQVSSGFQFKLGGAFSVAIPGPSGIFLRLKYNPNTIDRTLDWIVTKGPGAQGGRGLQYGMADTQINEFVSAKTKRNDFGGYF